MLVAAVKLIPFRVDVSSVLLALVRARFNPLTATVPVVALLVKLKEVALVLSTAVA